MQKSILEMTGMYFSFFKPIFISEKFALFWNFEVVCEHERDQTPTANHRTKSFPNLKVGDHVTRCEGREPPPGGGGSGQQGSALRPLIPRKFLFFKLFCKTFFPELF